MIASQILVSILLEIIKESSEMVFQKYPPPNKKIFHMAQRVKHRSKAMKTIEGKRDEYLSDPRMNVGFVIIMFWRKLIH